MSERALLLFGAAALLASCGAGPRTPLAKPADARVNPVNRTAVSASPLPPKPAAAPLSLRATLCAEHPACELRETIGSITTPSSGTRGVVRITYPEQPSKGHSDPPCTYEEYWLVAQNGNAISEHKFFAGGCALGAPEHSWCGWPPTASVRVDGTRAIAEWRDPTMRCSSAYKAAGTEVASLETFHGLHSQSTNFRILPPDETVTRVWDWPTLHGTEEWAVGGDSCPKLHRRPVTMIPKLEIDANFVASGWQSVAMIGCSTQLSAGGAASRDGAKAALSLRAVIANDSLFVEIADDRDPHAELPSSAYLRVCSAEMVPTFSDYCHARARPECTKVSADGSVVSGPLHVERAAHLNRYKIELKAEQRALTVVFADPKHGSSLASGPLQPFESTMMSSVFEIEPRLASCQTVNGALTLVQDPSAP